MDPDLRQMFPRIAASDPFLLFDYFRVPYDLAHGPSESPTTVRPDDPLHSFAFLRVASGQEEDGRKLYWPANDAAARGVERVVGSYRLDGIPIFGHVVLDIHAREWLARTDATWNQTSRIVDHVGSHVASVWRNERGDMFFPVDPGELIGNFWSERYQEIGTSAVRRATRTAALQAYYLVRPLIPRDQQLKLRRRVSRLQSRTVFPRWPLETSLHDLYDWLFRQVSVFAEGRVPFIAPWPDGYEWTLVLTHDVETLEGCRNIEVLRAVERSFGRRSSWNFVPMRYAVDVTDLDALTDEGCEIGVHGLYHDGRDVSSLRVLRKRLPMIREYAKRWDALGFRSPATRRAWDRIPMLGFDYDSSYPDADPYEPQPGGCCSLLPFFNRGTVELPITLAQDHTLFVILERRDAAVWKEKVEHIRGIGGMALALTHPDYAVDARVVDAYEELMAAYDSDPTVWHALPREVSAWWRRRADSRIEPAGDGWKITGPAATQGRIAFAEPGIFDPSSPQYGATRDAESVGQAMDQIS